MSQFVILETIFAASPEVISKEDRLYMPLLSLFDDIIKSINFYLDKKDRKLN